MKVRLIATDMDGTLLGADQQIVPENLQMLRAAQAQGIVVTLASGRIAQNLSAMARTWQFTGPIIACNGAMVWDAPYGACVAEHFLQPQTVRDCLQIVQRAHMRYIMFGQREMVFGHAFQSMEELRPWMHNISVSLREEDNLRIVCGKAASTRLAETGCMKILAYTDELSRLRRVRPLIEAFPTVDVVSSGDSNIEIMPTGVSKGSALEALAVRMGIEREEIMAFGDHENDHAMLSFAGQSVAMGNALPAIKEICRYVTETNVQGGVGKAVQRWALT